MSSEPQYPHDSDPDEALDSLVAPTDERGRMVWVMYPDSPREVEPRSASFDGFLQLLPDAAWQGRRFVGLGALFGLIFAIGYLLFADAVYVVKTLIHVELRQSVTTGFDPLRAGSTFIATQSEVISSPRVVRSTLEDIGLPEPSNGWMARLKAMLRPPADPAERLSLATLATVAAVEATPVLGTEVMAVTYRTEDAERGVVFLGTLIDNYKHFLRQGETKAHHEGLWLLRQREAEIDDELAARRLDLERLLIQSRSLDEVGDLDVHRNRLQEQAKSLVEAEAEAIRLANQLTSDRSQAASEVSEDEQLLDDLHIAETTLAELRSRLSDRHPDVRQARQRVRALRGQLQSDANATLDALERDLVAAERTHQQLVDSYDHQWERLRKLEMADVQEERIRSDIARLDMQRSEVASLLAGKELRVLELETDRTGTQVSVLEAPTIPVEPVWPRPGPVLIGCLIIGGIGGFAWAIFEYVVRHGALRTVLRTGTRVESAET